MREIILAPSFDEEFLFVLDYVEEHFGELIADQLEEYFKRTAHLLAQSPMIGKQEHGYPTELYGFVFGPSWIFYRFTDDKITFLHIRDGRMDKDGQSSSDVSQWLH